MTLDEVLQGSRQSYEHFGAAFEHALYVVSHARWSDLRASDLVVILMCVGIAVLVAHWVWRMVKIREGLRLREAALLARARKKTNGERKSPSASGG